MVVREKLQHDIERLPESFQAELMDFIEYLLAKAERKEEREWRGLSISSAMRGMEKEKSLYSPSDLKVTFS
jgi:DNA replication initiation complex subunit (GINS family)